jgi:hypothetical protein
MLIRLADKLSIQLRDALLLIHVFWDCYLKVAEWIAYERAGAER